MAENNARADAGGDNDNDIADSGGGGPCSSMPYGTDAENSVSSCWSIVRALRFSTTILVSYSKV